MTAGICEGCGKLVSPREVGSRYEVIGWVEVRTRGGSNAVADPKSTGRAYHEVCWKDRKYAGARQDPLL